MYLAVASCFMKQKYQLQMGLAQYKNAITLLVLEALIPLPALSNEVYNSILIQEAQKWSAIKFEMSSSKVNQTWHCISHLKNLGMEN